MKKPEPRRTQPIRNWGVLFGTQGAGPSQAPPGSPPPGGSAPPVEPVSQGVAQGYRVIEEYLRQGQNVARTMGSPFVGGGGPADDGLQNRLGAMFRSFSDFASLWMDMMGRVGAGGGAAPPPGFVPASGSAGPFPTSGSPGTSEAPKAGAPRAHEAPRESAPEPQGAAPLAITLDIESTRRVEVSVDLRVRSPSLSLVVHDLRAPEPDKPRLTGVKIEGLPDEERVCFHLHVPDELPPGVYSGLILDARTSLPRGAISVRIPSP